MEYLLCRLNVLFPDKDISVLQHFVTRRVVEADEDFQGEFWNDEVASTLPGMDIIDAMKRIKLLMERSDGRLASDVKIQIDLRRDLKLDKTKSQLRTSGLMSIRESKEKVPVLVEWKKYSGLWKTDIGNELFQRVELLTEFFRTASQRTGTIDLRVLPCLGYTHDDEKRQLGFVFRVPPSVSNRRSYIRLNTLLTAYQNQGAFPPSVGDRMQLALALCKAMFEFHEAEWFHKAFTSYNILIFCEAEDSEADDGSEGVLDVGKYSILAPYIVGFNYSRPSRPTEFSEPQNLSDELRRYQHPKYATVPLQKYRHEFDYYSLGIVLLEIGQWTPLATMMQGKMRLDQIDALGFAQEVTQGRCPELSSFVGDIYAQVVAELLGTIGEDRWSVDENEYAAPGLLLQFQTDILELLGSCKA